MRQECQVVVHMFHSGHCLHLSLSASPSPARFTDTGEHKKGHCPSRKTPPESKCLCMCGCMIIISQACLSAQRCAGTVCVCMWVTVQCAYLKINSRVCPLVIVASHVDKSEPHCVQRLVLKSIMESQRFLRLCVCLCGNAQTSNSPSARQASSRENCIMDDTVSTSMGHWT